MIKMAVVISTLGKTININFLLYARTLHIHPRGMRSHKRYWQGQPYHGRWHGDRCALPATREVQGAGAHAAQSFIQVKLVQVFAGSASWRLFVKDRMVYCPDNTGCSGPGGSPRTTGSKNSPRRAWR